MHPRFMLQQVPTITMWDAAFAREVPRRFIGSAICSCFNIATGQCTHIPVGPALRQHLLLHTIQRTTDELVHSELIGWIGFKALETVTGTAARLAAAVAAGTIVAATAAMVAAEQRPVRAGMRAWHRPDEVRRELGGILGVQRQRLRAHSRVKAWLQFNAPSILNRSRRHAATACQLMRHREVRSASTW